jgi:hypothetical protein
MITARVLIASAIMAALAWAVWALLNKLQGESLVAQIFEMGVAIGVGGFVYAKTVLAMRIPEARQIETLIMGRLRRRPAAAAR